MTPDGSEREWLPWVREGSSLVMRLDNREIYDIPLGHLRYSSHCMKWLSTIVVKSWATPEVMVGLVKAATYFCRDMQD